MSQDFVPIKVAHMVDTTNLGGAERMAINFVNDLSMVEGYALSLIISRNEGVGSALTIPGVQTICLQKQRTLDIAAFKRFIVFLKQHKIQILHAHTNSVYWALVAKTFFIPNLSVIWHDHLGARADSSAKFNLLSSIWSRMLDGYIGVSEWVMGWAKKYIKLKPERLLFLPNYPELKESDETALNFYMSKSGNPTFLCLANYRVEKEQVILVKAFEQVVKDLPEAKLLLAGKDIQPTYKAEVLQLIATLNLQKHVIDIGECTDVAALMKVSDIGVFASRFEGLPVSLLEFGMMGKPVVATEVGEMPAILGHGKWGALVAPQQTDALAAAMIAVGKNAALQKVWGKDFRQYVLEHYSKAAVINQLTGFYNHIVSNV